MSWQGIEGHDAIVEQFRASLARGRLASTYLFLGPPGIGKRTFALRLAQALLCEKNSGAMLEPCGLCPGCGMAEAGTHPDLLVVRKPEDRNFIPVETFIGDREHRMRAGLCHDIALKPFRGGRRIAIIDDADHLNEEGANSLLKTLEEPPPRSLLILVGTNSQRQLPTIRSRCQIVRFQPLPTDTVAGLLLKQQLAPDAATAQRLAQRSGGSLTRALELTDAELWDFRRQLWEALAEPELDGVGFAAVLSTFVDAAGKEAPPRRARLRQVLGFACDFYRGLMRHLAGRPAEGDAELDEWVQARAASWRFGPEAAADALEICLDASQHVDANVNQETLCQWWLDQLAQIARTGAADLSSAP